MPCGNAFSNIEPGAVINGTWDCRGAELMDTIGINTLG